MMQVNWLEQCVALSMHLIIRSEVGRILLAYPIRPLRPWINFFWTNPRCLEEWLWCEYQGLCQATLLWLPTSKQQVLLLPSSPPCTYAEGGWAAIFVQWLAELTDWKPHPQAGHSGLIEKRKETALWNSPGVPWQSQAFQAGPTWADVLGAQWLSVTWTLFSTWLLFLCVREL